MLCVVKTRVTRLRVIRRRFKRAWSNCVLYIPYILSGSPNECWLHTCNACVITSWRLGLRAPLVAHNKMKRPYFRYPPSLPEPSGISGDKQVIKSLPTRVIAVVFVYSNKSRRRIVMQSVQFEFRQVLHHYCFLWGHLQPLLYPKKWQWSPSSIIIFAIIVF